MLISITRFRCDACGVISGSIKDWTLIETQARTDHRMGRQLPISASPVGRDCPISSLGSNAVARHAPQRGHTDRLTSRRGGFPPGGITGVKIRLAGAF